MIFLGKRKFYIALIRNPSKLSTRFSSFASNSKKQQIFPTMHLKFQYLSQNFPLSFLPPIHHLIISINNVQHLHSNRNPGPTNHNHWPQGCPPQWNQLQPTNGPTKRTSFSLALGSAPLAMASATNGGPLEVWNMPIVWRCMLFEHPKHAFNAGRSEDLTY